MIIVEGPDGGGKTTLARKICNSFGLEYRRPPEELLSSTHGPSEGLVEWWQDQLRRPEKEYKMGVYDRTFWISEPIYSSISARKPLCDGELLWRGISDLWAENPLLIFCMTAEEAMLENTFTNGRQRLADIGDDVSKLRAATFLYWGQFGVWQQALTHVVQYDYNRDHWSFIDNAVRDALGIPR